MRSRGRDATLSASGLPPDEPLVIEYENLELGKFPLEA